MKREKYTLKEFWIDPIISSFKNMLNPFIEMLGFWKCDDCNKRLSPRVKKFEKVYQSYFDSTIGKISVDHEYKVCSKCKG